MNITELQRLKEFYHQAAPDQQFFVRNFVTVHYSSKIEVVFSELNIDALDFCEGNKNYIEMPDQIWELLQDDAAIETVEDLAAAEMLWWYENSLQSQIREQQFEQGFKSSLEGFKHQALAAGLDKKQLAKIVSQIEPQSHESTPEPEFDFQKHIDRLLKNLPILDRKKFLEQAKVLVKIREGGIFHTGSSERARS